MGVGDEEDVVFDQLDTRKLGYVTAGQVYSVLPSLDLPPVPLSDVEEAIAAVCGGKGMVGREEFVDVLGEIVRKQTTQEQALWDFTILDSNGDGRIELKDALLLFHHFHGDGFLLQTWQGFLASRVEPDADVYFDEISDWLSAPPGGTGCTNDKLMRMKKDMQDKQLEYRENQYHSLVTLQDDMKSHQDNVRRGSKRKLQKWNLYGIDSILFDDDDGIEEMASIKPASRPRESVGITDILNLLDVKYTTLRDKVLYVMAKYSADSDSEIAGIHQQLRQEADKLTGAGMAEGVTELSGHRAQLPVGVQGLMGEVGHALDKVTEAQEARVSELKAEGKDVQAIKEAIRDEFYTGMDAPTQCGEALLKLYERHQLERSHLLTRVQGVSAKLWATYTSLSRQRLLMDEEHDFPAAAIAVGLAERPPAKSGSGYSHDEHRSQSLADMRLRSPEGRDETVSCGGAREVDVTQGRLDILTSLVTVLEHKQSLERQALMSMLLSEDMQSSASEARKLSDTERKRRLNALRNQHTAWRGSSKTNQQSHVHRQMLKDGLGLYWAGKANGGQSTPNMAAIILAEVQHAQEVEFEIKSHGLDKKSSKWMCQAVDKEDQARVSEHFDNIAYVVLGAVDLSETEVEYVEALKRKYQALRDTVLTFALQDKHGNQWLRMSPAEREKELVRLRREEKAMRGEGRLDDMQTIIGPKSQTLPSLETLLGEKINCSSPSSAPVNLLADLVSRYDQDHDALLAWLRSPTYQVLSVTGRRMKILCLHVETRVAVLEKDYELACLSVGLMERVGQTDNSKADEGRLEQLAGRQLQLYKSHQMQGTAVATWRRDKSNTPTGDIFVWRESYAEEVYQRHLEERGRLLELLQDEGLRELAEVAVEMPRSERQERLAQLCGKRARIDMNTKDGGDEYADILEEAAALQVVCKMELLGKDLRRSFIPDDQVTCDMLVSLLRLQHREMGRLLTGLEQRSQADLESDWRGEAKGRENGTVVNVFTVLTEFQGDADNQQIQQLIDLKYSKLQEQLLSVCVSQKYIDKSEQDKQLKIMSAKLSALWHAGDKAGLDELVTVNLTKALIALMGSHRGEYALLHRYASGLLEDQEEEGLGRPMGDLWTRYSGETSFLRNCLQGVSGGTVMKPGDRTLLMCRLYREIHVSTRMAETGAMFEHLATAVGLAERQDKCRLKRDRERYIELANMLWKQNDQKRPSPKPAEVTQSTDARVLLKCVVGLVEHQHQGEVGVMLSLLPHPDPPLQLQASLHTQQQRSDTLATLHETYNNTVEQKERMKILQRAVVVCRESRRFQLPQDCQAGDDNVCASLLADLLQHQNRSADTHLLTVASKSPEELTSLQTSFKQKCDQGYYDNIAAVLFVGEKTSLTDEDVSKAVEEKYDALNDKLLMQALINQMDEATWLQLSEKERQQKLMELKLQQRRLKQQGRLDEAAELLGGLAKDKEVWEQLMGGTREEQERRLKERLERRRKQWRGEGKSEAECDELEKEELEQEDKRRQNILLQMDHRIEEEKEALLRQLMQSDDDTERERDRQMAMTRLKLEQRRVRQEDKFDSAAILLGLAEQTGEIVKDQNEKERKRQEKLALERLAAARRRRQAGEKTSVQPVEVDVDGVAEGDLMIVLLEVVDKRHLAERTVLIEASEEAGDEDKWKNMETEDLQSSLQELSSFRDGWRKSQNRSHEQQFAIFQQATGCNLELKSRDPEHAGKTADDHKVVLLADLQQIQSQDMSQILNRVQKKESGEVREELRQQERVLRECCHDNVATVLKLALAVENENQEVLQELDNKYAAIRDKMLLEALMQQYGHAEWARMSEQERQEHLVKIRLEERRLRRAGRVDELNTVLGKYLKDKQGLEKMLSESADVQRRRLEERLEMRRRLKEEREQAGMSTDDAELDALVEEEQAKKPVNVLQTLEHQYEAEKAALFSLLSTHQDQVSQERERQAAMARLRQDQRRLQREEKLDDACLIFARGQQNVGNSQKSFQEERDRQQQLAQSRLQAARDRRAKKDNQKEHTQDLPVEERLLLDMDERHKDEEDVLVKLLEDAKADANAKKAAHKVKAIPELKKELARLHQDQTKIATKSRQTAMSKESPRDPAATDKYKAEQLALLEKSLVYRMEVEQRLSEGTLTEEQFAVQIMVDLKQKQKDDADILQSTIVQKDKEFLEKVSEIQTLSQREGWYDNLTSVLFLVSDERQAEVTPRDDMTPQPDVTQVKQQMEEEFQQEKKEAEEKAAKQGEDVEAVLRQLEAEQEARRKVVLDQHEKQRLQLARRLEERRLASLEREFEAATAVQLIKMAGSQSKVVMEKREGEKSRQASLFEEKLAARRRSRRKTSVVPDVVEPAPSPINLGALRREKSNLNADVSEDHKQALTRQLIREQENLQKRRTEEQERQDQMVKRRLEQKRGKLKNEAAELFSLGERQKTILEQSQKDERDRQLSIMVERKNRVMYERTKTQKSTSSHSSGGFDDRSDSSLSKNELMEKTAKDLQDKFQKEAEAMEDAPKGALMNEADRFQQLKARRQQRRKKEAD